MGIPGFRPLIGPAGLALLGFVLRAALPNLPGDQPGASLAGALRAGGGVVGWLALAWALSRLFDILVLRAAVVARRPPYSRLLGDVARAALFGAAALAIAAQVFEHPALGILTTSSVVVALIGFALRNIIADLFSGIALSIEAPYRIGDWIETVQGATGQVTEVTWRSTRLINRDGVTLDLPNSLVAAQRLANYGAGKPFRVTLRVPLVATLPPPRVHRVLLAGALDAGRDFPGLAPEILLQDLVDGTAIWMLRFNVPDYGREPACRSAVAHAVLRAVQLAGLEVARPNRIVEVARPGPAAAQPRRDALLRQAPLFQDFLPPERAVLAQHMQERLVPRGGTVVRQGEAADSLFVVAEGALDVRSARGGAELPAGQAAAGDGHGRTVAGNGVERSIAGNGVERSIAGNGVERSIAGNVLERLVAGDVFGEMSLLTGQPRSATIVAATDAVVFEIGKAQLDPILQQRPALAEALAALMAARQARNAAGPASPQAPADPQREAALLHRLKAFFQLG